MTMQSYLVCYCPQPLSISVGLLKILGVAWCCSGQHFFFLIETGPKLGAALDHFLVLAPQIQPDYLRWVGTSGFLEGCSLKILSILYHKVCKGDLAWPLSLPLPVLSDCDSNMGHLSSKSPIGNNTQNFPMALPLQKLCELFYHRLLGNPYF